MYHDLKYHSIVLFYILVPINSHFGFDWDKYLIKFQHFAPLFFYIFFNISRFSSCPKHKKAFLIEKINFFAAFLKRKSLNWKGKKCFEIHL